VSSTTEKKSQGFGGETKEAKMARYAAFVAAADTARGLAPAAVAALRADAAAGPLLAEILAHVLANPVASPAAYAARKAAMSN
jgi:hypothetical protein